MIGGLAPDIITPDRLISSIGDSEHGGVYLADLGKLQGDMGTIPDEVDTIAGVTVMETIPGLTGVGIMNGVRVSDMVAIEGLEDMGIIPGDRVEDAVMIPGIMGTIPGVTGDMGMIPGVTGPTVLYPG